MANSQLLERPSKEQIALLPPFTGLTLGQIVVLRSPAQFDDAYRAIEKEELVGFDTESKPTFVRGAEETGPHVVQIALPDRAFIVQLGAAPPLAFLRAVIESRAIVKVGFGLKSDRGSLVRALGLKLAAAIELSDTLRALRYKQALGAKAAVAIVLGQRLQKSRAVTTSNWAAPVLKPNQLLYAANDAYAALCVFRALGCPYGAGDGGERASPAAVPLPSAAVHGES